jgi:NTP pyrophosphatase (non-canonical NTP hydrolase)
MELSLLTGRAMQIRDFFAAHEQRHAGRAWTREEIMQGFVGDVGDLMKLVMAKSGARSIADTDRKLAHELSDCLWSVLVLARLYDVDLEREFLGTMNELQKKLQTPKLRRPKKSPRLKATRE